MKILYFAGLRQRIGVGEEEIEPPPEIVDVAALIDEAAGKIERL